MGATFLEARIRCPISEIITAENVNAQDIVFPSGLPWSSPHDQPSLVVVQLNHFDCGGKALSVCMSHKLANAHTLCNFIDDWAAMARQSSENSSPQFIGASILPPFDCPSTGTLLSGPPKEGPQCITRRYVFDSDKINHLKAKATAELGVQKPTRVEVVSALLYKCAVSASALCSRSGSFKPSAFAFPVNLRQLIGLPAATQNLVGNFASLCCLLTTDEREMNFSRLVHEIRRMKVQQHERYKGIKTNDLLSAIFENIEQFKGIFGNNDIEKYAFSSVTKFPTYHIDFGWGSPIRVILAASPYKNAFHLVDNHNGDGIEAFVTLELQVMSLFQSDPELHAFASLTSTF